MIGLGTVQFGSAYGISNQLGQTTPTQVAEILEASFRAGVEILDTASAYGEAETVLGRALSENQDWKKQFKLVTKIAPGVSPLRSIGSSLARLQCDHIYGLLFHRSQDLVGDHSEGNFAEIETLLKEGIIKKWGVSVYEPSELSEVLNLYPIQLVQFPFNLLDRRFEDSGALKRLTESNIEIHVRSVFLQGLILMDPDLLPSGFTSVKPALVELRATAKALKISLEQLALSFVLSRPEIQCAVLGVNTSAQWKELLVCVEEIRKRSGSIPNPFERIKFQLGPEILNPALWPKQL